jgi:hypothetical protein
VQAHGEIATHLRAGAGVDGQHLSVRSLSAAQQLLLRWWQRRRRRRLLLRLLVLLVLRPLVPVAPRVVLSEQRAALACQPLDVWHHAAAQRADLRLANAMFAHARHAAAAEAVAARHRLRLLQDVEADSALLATLASCGGGSSGGRSGSWRARGGCWSGGGRCLLPRCLLPCRRCVTHRRRCPLAALDLVSRLPVRALAHGVAVVGVQAARAPVLRSLGAALLAAHLECR